jgi:two-component system chemotaxis sensor kinase CheA
MSRTAVNLPDLLPKQDGDGTPAGLNNADDLLAQLAGDEVDRLLSEADAAPAISTDLDHAATTATAAPADEAEASLDELFNELDEEAETKSQAKAASAPPAPPVLPAPVEPSPVKIAAARAETPAPAAAAKSVEPQSTLAPPQPAIPESAASALAAEMEEDEREHAAALRRMKGGGPALPQAPSPAPVAAPAPAPAKAPDPDAATAAGLELVAESAVAGEKTSGIMIDMQAVEDQAAENASDPILVRVLAWINSPLDGLSPSVRAGIGKVALVTTVNAVGVFLYVLLFRRH